MNIITEIDFAILDWIQENMSCGTADAFFSFITHFGDGGLLWIALSIVLIAIPKTRRTGITVITALALEALCCNAILKPLVARVRPYDINTAVQVIIDKPTDWSFPSGHTGASFAAASALFFRRDRLWIPAFLLTLMIAFSRLYLYVHYPSDVLTGAVLGILAGWLGNMVLEKAMKRREGLSEK